MCEYLYIFVNIILVYSYIVKAFFCPYNLSKLHKIKQILENQPCKLAYKRGYISIVDHSLPFSRFRLQKGVNILISYAPLFKTMKEKHISTYRLEKLGFSRATYYSIYKGNSVSTNTINQLCKLLKCSVSEIIEYIDDEETDL